MSAIIVLACSCGVSGVALTLRAVTESAYPQTAVGVLAAIASMFSTILGSLTRSRRAAEPTRDQISSNAHVSCTKFKLTWSQIRRRFYGTDRIRDGTMTLYNPAKTRV